MDKVKKNEDAKKRLENKSTFGLNDSPNIETEIKSVAIVKYSEVTAPALFTRLRCNTNLNLLPSNWLSNSAESYGLRPAYFFHRPGFSSFRMAHMFPDCVGEVDVISDAENIKKLLKIPYSHGSVSMMIHRIENTLLIDEFDVHKYLLREAECQWEWFKKFFIENIMESAKAKDKLIHHRDNSRNSLQEKSLVSKFLYHSLVVADTNKQKIEKTGSGLDNVNTATPLPITFKNEPPLPDPSLEEESPDPTSNHKFARNVVWTFEDIQMLLGTDMPIFGGGTHPCISLRLRDMTKPINVLTGMDYWLDNLMCNVPEVIMCYHLNGIVQKYELIKTEDLPHLENSKFSPKVIRDIAQNILSFLKANATKAGHTYWLFKGKDDDVVKLYDLTSLCTDALDEKGQTPFTVPVAMLLYRVARNMKNSSDGQRQAATIRLLLKNCLSLLSPEKYPEIVTSSHYMLADLYIPAGIDPASPELCSFELSTSDETNYETQFVQDLEKEEVAIKSMSLANISETHLEEMECITPPLPVALDLEIRCKDSIRHVLQGLKSLKFLNEFDQKKENTKIKSEEPIMAKPFQKIPMPYQSLSKESEDEKKMKKKKNKKKKKNVKEEEEEEKEKELPSRSLLWKPTIKALPTLRIQAPNNSASWNIHLKTLLYEKICLVYATLMEKSYSEGKFGLALQYIKMILKGRKVLNTLQEGLYKDIESYLLGQAGDTLFMIIKNSQKMEVFDLEYSSFMDVDQEILLEIKEEKIEKKLTEEEAFPQNLNNLEELLLKSRRCYQKALECELSKFDKESLLRRLGNIENELGVFYMNQAAGKYHKEIIKNKTVIQGSTYEELFKKSREHLDTGIQIFDRVKDEANLALLYSNTGRLMRVQAHFASVTDSEDNEFLIKEKCFYKKSIAYYQKALQVLGDRKHNLAIWDLINWELSTTLFGMASLLQDYPTSINNKDDVEKELVEILHKALKYCDADTPGLRQPVYQYRSAMIHHRLASLYHKLYRFYAEDEARKKKLQQLCNRHYEKSIKLLLCLENSSEYLRVQLERVAFFEFKAEGAPSDTVKIKHYEHGLELLLEATTMLKIISERDLEFYIGEDDQLSEKSKQKTLKRDGNKENIEEVLESKSELENELILLKLYEQRLQFILMCLTKLNLNRNDLKKGYENLGKIYKKLYELSLRSNVCKDNPVKLSKSLFIIVTNILKTLNLNSNSY